MNAQVVDGRLASSTGVAESGDYAYRFFTPQLLEYTRPPYYLHPSSVDSYIFRFITNFTLGPSQAATYAEFFAA